MTSEGYHGNRGERPRQGDGLDDLEQFLDVNLDNWNIDEMEQLVREALSPKPASSITDPSEIMSQNLEYILGKSSEWGLNIDKGNIWIQYHVARKEDRKMIDSLVKHREKSSQSDRIHVTDKLHVSKMRAEEGGTKGTIEIEVFTLDEIQNEILYHNTPDREMENPPDVWYSKANHRLTPKGLGWHLAPDDWSFEDDPESNQIYFVDVDPYYDENGKHSYMVALLHHLIEEDEQDEPVPVEWKVCPDAHRCNNLDTHLRHQPSTKNVIEFLARNMRDDSMKYIGPKDDDKLYPAIVKCSTELLNTEDWTVTFARQQNDLHLICKYAPKEAKREVEEASTSVITAPPTVPPVSTSSRPNTSTTMSNRISRILKSAKDKSVPNNSPQSLFKTVVSKAT
ncbi:hypothetical protein CPB86DRAFT_785595 [Serendipita vermifera]|nr:hypothetical protein CPB86DRAFT_785595 [Serendipita vermifera]